MASELVTMRSPAHSFSVYHLLKSLGGNNWLSVYDIMLDITGQHRRATIPLLFASLCRDVQAEMIIKGLASDAQALADLCHPLDDGGTTADVLLVLLLCSDLGSSRCNHSVTAPFSQNPISVVPDAYRRQVASALNVFNFDDALESPLRSPRIASHDPSEVDASLAVNCIAEASRLEHERFHECLREKLSIHVDAPLLERARGVHTPSKMRDRHHSPLFSLGAAVVEQNFAEGRNAVASKGKEELLHLAHDEADPQFFHRILYMCLGISEYPRNSSVNGSDDAFTPSPLFSAIFPADFENSSSHWDALLYRSMTLQHLKARRQELRQGGDPCTAFSLEERALMCGLTVQSMSSFIATYSCSYFLPGLQALISFLEDRTDKYMGSLLSRADVETEDSDASDVCIVDVAELLCLDFIELEEVLERTEASDGSFWYILNMVSMCFRRSPHSACLQDLFLSISTGWEKVADEWVMEGARTVDSRQRIMDAFPTKKELAGTIEIHIEENFVVKETDLLSMEEIMFLERAGQGRTILRNLSLSISDNEAIPGLECKRQPLGECHAAESVSFRDANCPEDTRRLPFTDMYDENADETECDVDVARDGNVFLKDLPSGHGYDGKAKDVYVRSKRNTMAADVEEESNSARQVMTPICFKEGLMTRYRGLDGMVQRRLLQYFVDDVGIFAHLRNIKRYVLLGCGEFAHALVEQMNAACAVAEKDEKFVRNRFNAAMTFYGSVDAGAGHVRKTRHLKRCFRTAVNLSGGANDSLTDLISVEVFGAQDIGNCKTLWECDVDLKYDAGYALKLLISDKEMRMYSKMHGFFLRVCRAKMNLRRLFMMSRRKGGLTKLDTCRLIRDNEVQGRLWVFCMDAEKFVDEFGGYFMDQILGSRWREFEESWSSFDSIWDARKAHSEFVEGSTQQCLLDERQKNVRRVIGGGFDIIDSVHEQVCQEDQGRYTQDVDVRRVVDLLVSARMSVRRRASFLIDVLARLSDAGCLPATWFGDWG